MRSLIRLAVALVLLFGRMNAGSPTSPAYSRAADVRRLAKESAAGHLPVSLRAVVTFVNTETGELFVQDDSGGIFVFIRNSTSDRPLQTGQSVQVDGVTSPGDFSSSVTDARIRVLGNARMPKPLVLSFDDIRTGEPDSQWGRLTGVLRAGREEHGLLYLDAVTRGGAFLVIMKDYPVNWETRLIDSEVTLDGVLAALFNERRQVTGVRIFVPSRRFMQIVDPAPESPFQLPVLATARVGAFRPGADWDHRIHVRASVTALVSRDLMYIADDQGSLAIGLWKGCEAAVGSIVDIVGFPGTLDNRPALEKAVCRPNGETAAEHPIEVSADQILPQEVATDGSGLAFAKATRYDLRLVAVTGTLVQSTRGALVHTLTLISGDQTFNVTMPASARLSDGATTAGARLRVVGVCLITFDDYQQIRSFRILARGADDVQIAGKAPWLTIRKAVFILFPLLFLVLASSVWIAVLRRHVAIRTRELESANERLRQLSMEDSLTRAATRRYFDERLRAEILRCHASGAPISLIFVDLDQFKLVNDLYGHQRGDEYLVRIAIGLKNAIASLRDAVLARYGGEEFAALLPEVSAAKAEALAETMRRSIQDLAIYHEASPFDRRQTVSIGTATFSDETGWGEADQLIGFADQALYRAKANGRNQVVSSAALRSHTDPMLAVVH